MINYIIIVKDEDLLNEAIGYVKELLTSACISFDCVDFNGCMNLIYEYPINYRIDIDGASSIYLSINQDDDQLYGECVYHFKGINAPGRTLWGFIKGYLDNENISYPKIKMVRTWKEIVARNGLHNYSKTQFDAFMKDVLACYPYTFARGGKSVLLPWVEECRPTIDELVYSELDSYSSQRKKLMMEMNRRFEIKKVIFNDPATIVMWANGDKTVVKAQNEIYDPEKGLAMAFAKRALGGKGSYYDIFKQWLPNEKADFNDFEKFEKTVQKEAEHALKVYLEERDK